MGNLIEGGVYGGPVQPTVNHSPAVQDTIAETVQGTNNYANRIENYTARDIYQGGGNPLNDLMTLGLLSQLMRPGHGSSHGSHGSHSSHGGCGSRSDRFERFANKNYEKNPPNSRTGEVLNLMKTNEAFKSELSSKTNGGFLGLGKTLHEHDVAELAHAKFGKMGYSSTEIEEASRILVKSEEGKYDNWSKLGWILGIPAAIGGALLLPWMGRTLIKSAAQTGAAIGAAPFGGIGHATGSLNTFGTLLAGAIGFFGFGGAAAALGSSIDKHGEDGISREDITEMGRDQATTHLSREDAPRYYREIHGRRGCHGNSHGDSFHSSHSTYNDGYMS